MGYEELYTDEYLNSLFMELLSEKTEEEKIELRKKLEEILKEERRK